MAQVSDQARYAAGIAKARQALIARFPNPQYYTDWGKLRPEFDDLTGNNEDYVFITSIDTYTMPKWKEGRTFQVRRDRAAHFMYQSLHRPATEDEIAAFHAQREERLKTIQKEERARKKTTVSEFSDEQMAFFKNMMAAGAAQEREKTRKGKDKETLVEN
jgi:hypothetical protein